MAFGNETSSGGETTSGESKRAQEKWPFDKTDDSSKDKQTAGEEESREEEEFSVSFEGKRVLIVDDSNVMRKIIKNALNQMGFSDYAEAADGHAALKEFGEDPVDLIISDWNMPKMTGLEFLKTVRGHRKLKDIPFLMVTSEGDEAKIREAIEAGVSQYIIKHHLAAVLLLQRAQQGAYGAEPEPDMGHVGAGLGRGLALEGHDEDRAALRPAGSDDAARQRAAAGEHAELRARHLLSADKSVGRYRGG